MLSVLNDLDASLLGWIHANLHNGFLDWLMPMMRNMWTWMPFYVFLIGFMLLNFGKRGALWVLLFIFTIALSDTVSSKVIKYQVKRIRPCHTEQVSELKMLISCGGPYSFTSSHASNHFAMATFIWLTLGGLFRRIKWPVLAWAGLVSFAQVYVGVHYPLDIIAGALLGMIIGAGIAWYYRKRLYQWSVNAIGQAPSPN